MWTLMEGMDWKFLPDAGGLLDQNDALMHDLLTISWRRQVLKELMDGPQGSVGQKANLNAAGSED